MKMMSTIARVVLQAAMVRDVSSSAEASDVSNDGFSQTHRDADRYGNEEKDVVFAMTTMTTLASKSEPPATKLTFQNVLSARRLLQCCPTRQGVKKSCIPGSTLEGRGLKPQNTRFTKVNFVAG